MPQKKESFCVLVLAAGKGTRMHSRTPKVLQTLLDKPLIHYLLAAVENAEVENVAVMLGFCGEKVEEWLGTTYKNVDVLWQREQLGTGHAVKLAQSWWKEYKNILILPGDTPLITASTLKLFLEQHIASDNKCSFLSFDTLEPTGYGRVIRFGDKVKVVEEKDATDLQRQCHEVNSGMYAFNTEFLFKVIDKLTCKNAQKEYYLPDVLTLIQENNGKVDAIKTTDSNEFLGVNDPTQLAEATLIMRNRILKKWMLAGVRFMDPSTTWIGPDVKLGNDIALEPNVQLWGSTTIGSGSRIGSFTVLNNVQIGDNVSIIGSTRINNSYVRDNSTIGPYAFIREGTELMDNVHVGRFVEIKNSHVSKGTKIPHLSYIGDSEIGENTNIGAGTITANYDGEKKNGTIIGNNCFIGSDTIFIAPIKVGNNAMTAAGSTITKDVPEGSLAISRGKQRIMEEWYARKKKQYGGK